MHTNCFKIFPISNNAYNMKGQKFAVCGPWLFNPKRFYMCIYIFCTEFNHWELSYSQLLRKKKSKVQLVSVMNLTGTTTKTRIKSIFEYILIFNLWDWFSIVHTTLLHFWTFPAFAWLSQSCRGVSQKTGQPNHLDECNVYIRFYSKGAEKMPKELKSS